MEEQGNEDMMVIGDKGYLLMKWNDPTAVMKWNYPTAVIKVIY